TCCSSVSGSGYLPGRPAQRPPSPLLASRSASISYIVPPRGVCYSLRRLASVGSALRRSSRQLTDCDLLQLHPHGGSLTIDLDLLDLLDNVHPLNHSAERRVLPVEDRRTRQDDEERRVAAARVVAVREGDGSLVVLDVVELRCHLANVAVLRNVK